MEYHIGDPVSGDDAGDDPTPVGAHDAGGILQGPVYERRQDDQNTDPQGQKNRDDMKLQHDISRENAA